MPTGFYRLTPQHDTGKALDVGGCSSADNAKVDTYAYNGGRCQQWFIDYQGDGSYTISDRNSGKKALEVLNCASARNSTVDIYPYWGGDCQEWYLDPVGDGSYRITHRLTGQALDVLNCSTAAVPRRWTSIRTGVPVWAPASSGNWSRSHENSQHSGHPRDLRGDSGGTRADRRWRTSHVGRTRNSGRRPAGQQGHRKHHRHHDLREKPASGRLSAYRYSRDHRQP
ncbi:RICIN domain-containing protein [Fodinicola feengrottensis]|uniref:RICIN domain-containing protein n=1 Tax=Fodinicola feengrottensis TaxID=435914 RepID=UPI0024418175|nr:RICIN domain-containing protein [Fodinicola feengrottensis]